MENLVFNDLTIEVGEPVSGKIRLDWKGKSNDRQPRKILDPFFVMVCDAAKEMQSAIEMHFEDLEYFNSSTITAIIQLIQDLRNKQVPLEIVYDQTMKWQKLSFDALKIFEKKQEGLLKISAIE
ncbi:SiaC family regulatory phosphoprotein [Desulfatibacillum aliphaticivorans]|uniref:STAS domain-containing protein n=1 Tax=Desulfatibacillum aliphaticivorans TaxID=218208 RepID=B8F9N7_DESAL|nr:SiaC family regulatory phosphoprotein [Desulfatibacillum aliphaticivorans]ACL02983.1 conserved hypothetical protein [Desulfatibacillum aliphaticivorans]